MIASRPSLLDWYPNLHTAHSGLRIEFLGVTLEEIRRTSGSAHHLKAGSRKPLVDSVQSLKQLRNMFAMGKNRISLGWDGRNAEFAGKTRRAGDLDAHQIVDTVRAESIEAQAISCLAYLSGDIADVRPKTQP